MRSAELRHDYALQFQYAKMDMERRSPSRCGRFFSLLLLLLLLLTPPLLSLRLLLLLMPRLTLLLRRKRTRMCSPLAAQAGKDGGVSYSVVRPTAFFKSVSGQLEVVAGGAPFVYFDLGADRAKYGNVASSATCNPISEPDLAMVRARSRLADGGLAPPLARARSLSLSPFATASAPPVTLSE